MKVIVQLVEAEDEVWIIPLLSVELLQCPAPLPVQQGKGAADPVQLELPAETTTPVEPPLHVAVGDVPPVLEIKVPPLKIALAVEIVRLPFEALDKPRAPTFICGANTP